MKKNISMFLAICLMVSMLSLTSYSSAVTGSESIAEQSIRALGIITGDENGNMNLYGSVTRAEFAKMMVAASVFKNTIGNSSGYSLFKDVKQSHWAVEYIKLAVNKSWFVGYLDGTFRPENTITFEEGATALLRLLGYTSDDIVGTYPSAQLSKFDALNLGKNTSGSQGQTLTRYDCMTIFYNLMSAKEKSGSVYAKSLGYKISDLGELDYSSLITAEMKGPFVLGIGEPIGSKLPFSSSNVSVYKNGSISTLSSASAYDVYYYNSNLRTVWLYDSKVSGTYTAVSPNSTAPISVTVAGTKYDIGSSTAAYKMSSLGPFTVGDSVTLLLGMDGTVVDVMQSSAMNSVYYGIVISTQTSSYTDGAGNTVNEKTIKIACTDGIIRQYAGSGTVGSAVSITFTSGQMTVSTLSSRGLSGTVNSVGTSIGSLSFADNVEIIDTNADGAYAKIYSSRLAGVSLYENDVRYYALDASGKISKLVLNDATGDLYSYGIITRAEEDESVTGMSGSYAYIISGTAGSLRTSSSKFGVSEGGAAFYYSGSTISKIKNIEGISLSSSNEQYATSNEKKYLISENVQAYQYVSGSYYQVSLDSILDTQKYALRGYYDNLGCNAGGRIRIIVAKEKENIA